jgi:YfiH family protein
MSKSFVKSSVLRSPHAFATRHGGVSRHDHTSSLNLAFGRGDDDATVLKNLEIFAECVGFDASKVISLPQIHSDRVFKVCDADVGKGYFVRDDIESADGYVTDSNDVVLGIKTADCVPILFEAEVDGMIVAVGAVHAGWRGTAAKIAVKCVDMLCREYGASPDNIRVAIGPCIHKCCYQVGDDLLENVSELLGAEIAEKYITRDPSTDGKYLCDLPAINLHLLLNAGVLRENIDILPDCTCCQHEKYFSHRYSNGQRGTMLNVIFKEQC